MTLVPRQLSCSLISALLLAVFLAVTPIPSAGSAPTSDVYILQGVPGSDVDVRLDGELLRSGVASKAVIGPLDLAPGSHTIGFESDGWAVDSTFDVQQPSEDVVVHRAADPSADPAITVFANPLGAVRAGHGRLVVAHTAVVPPADIRAGGEVIFANVANGEFASAEVPEDVYSVDVVPTGGDKPLFGPVDLEVKAGSLTRVFAIGQPRQGGMDAIVQVLPIQESGGQAAPSVDAGMAGLPEPAGERGPSYAGLALFLAGVAAVGGVLLRRHHARR